jgi:Fe-S oxidoreductase
MLAVPLHIFLAAPEEKRAALPAPAVDPPRTGTVADCTRRQLIEIDACVRCGRCRKPCSIYRGGIPYAPVTLLNGLKEQLLKGKWNLPQVGSAVGADALWACSTCLACEERCPMSGEHAVRIVELRRDEVGRGAIPATTAARFAEVESSLAAVPAPITAPQESGQVYVWPGCRIGNGEPETILPALLNTLVKGGYSPLLLQPPTCCGGTVRRLGNEALFQRAAMANIDYLKALEGALIITPCPHCFNTLKNEYPRFGGNYRVRHHSQFLADMLEEGRLGSPGKTSSKVAFHDPCFLGRYNAEFAAPRKLLRSVAVTVPQELKLSRKKSFCCGSGGGTVPESIARENGRQWLHQAMKEGVETVVTGCPYCRENLQESLMGDVAAAQPNVVDIVELLEQGRHP